MKNKVLNIQRAPRVFISYSWDSESHKAWVQKFAKRLRIDGVDARIDQWYAEPGHSLTKFIESEIRQADFVLLVCTELYKAKSDLRSGGIGYEGNIITGEIFTKFIEGKYIAILREREWFQSSPSYMLHTYYIDLRDTVDFELNYNRLLKKLFGFVDIPTIGTRTSFSKSSSNGLSMDEKRYYCSRVLERPQLNARLFGRSSISIQSLEPLPLRVVDPEQIGTKPEIKIDELIELKCSGLIIGEPGSGKSTSLKRLTHILARRFLQGNSSFIPVFIELKWFKGNLEGLIQNTMNLYGLRVESRIKTILDSDVIFFLDGFDEANNQETLISQIIALPKNLNSRFIVSSRPSKEIAKLNFPTFFMSPISTEEIVQIAALYLGKEEFDQLENFYGYSGPWGMIREWANPLYVWMFCIVLRETGNEAWRYPRGKILKTLLEDLFLKSYEIPKRRSSPEGFDVSINIKIKYLCCLANWLLTNSDSYFIEFDEAERIYKNIISKEYNEYSKSPISFIHELILHGIIEENSGRLSFWHKSVRNYFAARFLSMENLHSERQLIKLSKQDHWVEPISLLAGFAILPSKTLLKIAENLPELAFELALVGEKQVRKDLVNTILDNLLQKSISNETNSKERIQAGIWIQRLRRINPGSLISTAQKLAAGDCQDISLYFQYMPHTSKGTHSIPEISSVNKEMKRFGIRIQKSIVKRDFWELPEVNNPISDHGKFFSQIDVEDTLKFGIIDENKPRFENVKRDFDTIANIIKSEYHDFDSKTILEDSFYGYYYPIYFVNIVVSKAEECYLVLGLVYNLFTPIKERFQDYIATPKSDMSQWIEAHVIRKNGKRIEFRIQTTEMWSTNISNQFSNLYKKTEEILTLLHHKFPSFSTIDIILNRDKNQFVAVFTKDEDHVFILKGSTALDFAFHLHTHLGLLATKAIVNSQYVPLQFVLSDFDRVKIIKGSQPVANRQRLGWVRSRRAQKYLVKYIKDAEQKEWRDKGAKILESLYNEIGISEVDRNKVDNYLLSKHGQKHLNELTSFLGRGAIQTNKIRNLIISKFGVFGTKKGGKSLN